VLKRFTVAFDYAAKKMYLAPNADFGKADAFDRSGLWLLGAGDALEVADVAKGSAAARAGLHVGDRIIAIGDEQVGARALPEWRQRLRELPAGTKLVLAYERADKAAKAELVLAERIAAHWKSR
jgi:C-terminal processing protease CtpA/Prc